MIKFENGMLVLSNIFTKEDVAQINEYTEYVIQNERRRLTDIVNATLDRDTAEEVVFLLNDYNVL